MAILAELLFEIVLEVLSMGGAEALQPSRWAERPFWVALFYVLLGLLAGTITLGLFPGWYLQTWPARIAALVLAPVGSGLTLMAFGWWRRRHRPDVHTYGFAYGYLFGLTSQVLRLVANAV